MIIGHCHKDCDSMRSAHYACESGYIRMTMRMFFGGPNATLIGRGRCLALLCSFLDEKFIFPRPSLSTTNITMNCRSPTIRSTAFNLRNFLFDPFFDSCK